MVGGPRAKVNHFRESHHDTFSANLIDWKLLSDENLITSFYHMFLSDSSVGVIQKSQGNMKFHMQKVTEK